MALTPLARPGWVVTSLTRSPPSQTSRGCSRRPSMYCRPVRAPMVSGFYSRRWLDRARGDVHRQRQQRGVEDERHDAVRRRGPADALVGDADVGDLGRHADDERKVDEVPVVGGVLPGKGQTAAVVLVVE